MADRQCVDQEVPGKRHSVQRSTRNGPITQGVLMWVIQPRVEEQLINTN